MHTLMAQLAECYKFVHPHNVAIVIKFPFFMAIHSSGGIADAAPTFLGLDGLLPQLIPL